MSHKVGLRKVSEPVPAPAPMPDNSLAVPESTTAVLPAAVPQPEISVAQRSAILAAVATLLEMSEADSAATIAMVQAYRNAQRYHAKQEAVNAIP